MTKEDLPDLTDALNREIKRAVARQLGDLPPQEDPPRRRPPEIPEDYTEDVPFNPNNQTGFGDREVVFDGYSYPIHDTHNLRTVLSLIMRPRIRHKTTASGLELASEEHGPKLESGELEALLREMTEYYPRLYAKLEEIVKRTYEATDAINEVLEISGRESEDYERVAEQYRLSKREKDLEDYFLSKGFDGMAATAAETGMSVDLSQVCTWTISNRCFNRYRV